MMDTTQEYLLMCEKAARILPQREPRAWDYWYMEDKRVDECGVFVVSGYTTDSGIYGPGVGGDGGLGDWHLLFPVWRQDQLQEMCRDKVAIHLVYSFNSFCNRTLIYGDLAANEKKVKQGQYIQQFRTMEQLWLSFVMRENYGKKWDGEGWIKADGNG